MPLNARLSAGELAAILRDAGATLLAARASMAPLVAGVLAEDTPLRPPPARCYAPIMRVAARTGTSASGASSKSNR